MATKASGTFVLIIEKQHASWDLMGTALPAYELRLPHQLRVASARPILGLLGPCARLVPEWWFVCIQSWLMACQWLAYHPVDC